MLQLNPNEIIRINRLIDNSLSKIETNILYFNKKYSNNPSELEALDIKNIIMLKDRIKNSALFLTNIIHELEEATGEDVNKIATANHSLNFFENKLINYYAKNINNNAKKEKLEIIDLCYSKDDKLTSLCQKKNFVEYVEVYFKNFNPENFGMDKDTFINDLLEIYDKRGASEAYSIIHALENNCPSNYFEYKFNPTSQIHNNNYYDFNKTVNNYQTNSEIINVNGYNFEIVQVLPKDYNKVEQLAYNFGKANIINTMRTLPNKYLELCSCGDTNVITLTCGREMMNNNVNWAGYYKPSSFLSSNNNSITIDIHGSFNDNTFYTQDTLIHEMGHKFDDMIHKKSIIDWLFGNTSYTKNSGEWANAYKKYGNVLNSINRSGYTTYPNVNEFFGDTAVAYFKDPDILKTMCPEAYQLMNNMLDGEYGYSYSEKIVAILNAS